MKMYEYVAWLKPTQKEQKNGEVEILTPHPKVISADDDKQALRRAVVQAHADLMKGGAQPPDSTLDRLDICVREIKGL